MSQNWVSPWSWKTGRRWRRHRCIGGRAREPDGYTLSIATVSTMAVNPACRPNDLPYDPIKDFQPVTNFANTANVVAVNPKFPAKDFRASWKS